MYFKKMPEKYTLFFVLEMIAGLTGFVCVILFGEPLGEFIGIVPLVLLLLMVIVSKKKIPDERELQLLYKSGALTFVLFYISVVLIYKLLPEIDLPFIMAFPVLMWHGLISTIIFWRE